MGRLRQPTHPMTDPGRNAEQSWRGQKRSNETHGSTTDPDARLARKSDGQASILAYAGHVLMENRSGLVAQSCLTHATGTAERDAALVLVDRQAGRRRITLGGRQGLRRDGLRGRPAPAPGDAAHRNRPPGQQNRHRAAFGA